MYALLLAIALIAYGSLYPWHFTATNGNPWFILIQSWPPQWDIFAMRDASVNIAAYAPLGMLAFRAFARRLSPWAAAAAAILTGLALSVCMELAQVYLPSRSSSVFDIVSNITGACAGALAAWRFRKLGIRLRQYAAPPVLLLASWVWYHFYPFAPRIAFSRVYFELIYWLHPTTISRIGIWSYTAEWIAVGVALQRIFGRVRLRWLPMAFAVHLAFRPILVSMPLMPEDAAGALVAALLWKTLPESVRSSPWVLISAVVMRDGSALHWADGPSGFTWIPFQTFLASHEDITVLSQSIFDYGAILWLWCSRGVSYAKTGLILAGSLALVAVMQRNLAGDFLSMTDPALVLLVALAFRRVDSNQHKPAM